MPSPHVLLQGLPFDEEAPATHGACLAVPHGCLVLQARIGFNRLALPAVASRIWPRLRGVFPDALAAVILPTRIQLVIPAHDPGVQLRQARAVAGQIGRLVGTEQLMLPIPRLPMAGSITQVQRWVREIEHEPVRLGLVRDPFDWRWSTHRDLCRGTVDPWVPPERMAATFRDGRHGFTHRHRHFVTLAGALPVGERELAMPSLPENHPRLPLRMIAQAAAMALRTDAVCAFEAGPTRRLFVRLAQWLADARYQHRRHGYRINFANALSKMKNNLVRLFLETSPLDLSWRLLQRMADAVVAVRPGRKFPRDMKKVRVPGFQMQYRRTR